MTTTRYLIGAYSHHGHLRRLCRALGATDPGSQVTVLFDIGKQLPDPGSLGSAVQVLTTKREVAWGDGTFLHETMLTLRRLMLEPWDHLVMLTGQDYPIRPPTEVVRRLEAASKQGLLWSQPVDPPADPRSADELQRRYFFRHRWVPNAIWKRGGGARGVGRALRASARLLGPQVYARSRPRGEPAGIGIHLKDPPIGAQQPCRKGPDHFALHRSLVADLLRSVDEAPRLYDHFLHTVIPSEAWFHTVLWPRRDHLVLDYLHFTRWHGPHPRVLVDGDFDDLQRSRFVFARKFDASSNELLDRIDTELLGLQRPIGGP